MPDQSADLPPDRFAEIFKQFIDRVVNEATTPAGVPDPGGLRLMASRQCRPHGCWDAAEPLYPNPPSGTRYTATHDCR